MYMSRAHTTKQIDFILRRIGADGLGGVRVNATSYAGALEQLTGVPPTLSTRFVAELRRQALVEWSKTADEIRIQLSVKGIHRLQRAAITDLVVPVPDSWDGHWRMVHFDLPARHKHERYVFTSQLRRLGFVMLHDSTWYHPYPCFAVVETLVQYCGISRYVTMAEITQLDVMTTRRLHRAFPGLTTHEV